MNCLLLLVPILMIGPYSILKSSHDNTKAIQKSVSQTLNQCDSIMTSLYSHIDNAIIFFSSNPRVTLQLDKAFKEKALSLDSLKNIENLSLYFQNLIFTNAYIKDIYVYYDNPYQRIYVPQKGAIQTYQDLEDSDLVRSYKQSGSQDFWIEVRRPQLGSKTTPSTESLFFYQKLYTRSTNQNVGVIIFEFNLNELAKYFDTIRQYNSQVIYLADSENRFIYTNSSSQAPDAELARLISITEDKDNQHLYSLDINGTNYKAAYLSSSRANSITYFTSIPSAEIYKTTRSLSETYGILTLCAVAMSFLLAFYKSNREYRYLNGILDIFSNPSSSQKFFETMPQQTRNPFEYIMLNIIRLFVQQDYLKVQDAKKEYKIQMLKMQALQHQINPHFLHNTLNSIYWEAVRLTGSENPCSGMVSNLSYVMRYSLSDPQENVMTGEELNYLKKYLEIMRIRYSHKFDVNYRTESDCNSYPIKKMILQPLVENSIYHGIKEKEGKGTICIGVRSLKKSVVFYVFDNGTGISKPELARLNDKLLSTDETADQHIGLVNTNLRLKLAYGDHARLHIKSWEGSFTLVYFFVDYETSED